MNKNVFDLYYKYGSFLAVVAWICISSSRLLKFWVTYDEISVAYSEGDFVQRVQLLFIIAFVMPLLIKRRNKIIPLLRINFWLLILFAYCTISLLWSDLPATGFKRIFKSFCYLIILCIVFTEDNPVHSLIRIIKASAFLILGMSIFMILVFPAFAYKEITGEVVICGVAAHKNQLGLWAFTATVMFLWQVFNSATFRKRLINIILFLISFILLIECKSSTSLLMAFSSIFVICYYYLSRPFGWKGYWMIASVILTFILFSLLVMAFFTKESAVDSLFNLVGKDATLTGRAFVWQQVIEIGKEKWLLGHGFGTFWLTSKAEWIRYSLDWEMFQSHNGYLDTFLQLGVVGCVLTLFYIVNGFKGCFSLLKYDCNAGILMVTYLAAMLVGNFSETIFSIQNHEFWFISIFTCIRLPSDIQYQSVLITNTKHFKPVKVMQNVI
jgi:O-antigen ligase